MLNRGARPGTDGKAALHSRGVLPSKAALHSKAALPRVQHLHRIRGNKVEDLHPDPPIRAELPGLLQEVTPSMALTTGRMTSRSERFT
jgi:hypothetical protein